MHFRKIKAHRMKSSKCSGTYVHVLMLLSALCGNFFLNHETCDRWQRAISEARPCAAAARAGFGKNLPQGKTGALMFADWISLNACRPVTSSPTPAEANSQPSAPPQQQTEKHSVWAALRSLMKRHPKEQKSDAKMASEAVTLSRRFFMFTLCCQWGAIDCWLPPCDGRNSPQKSIRFQQTLFSINYIERDKN